MSRRRGTEEERRRKKALFNGGLEVTKAPHVAIKLTANKRGAGMYHVTVVRMSTVVQVASYPFSCRTLGEADELIAELERLAHAAAAAIALGVV